MKSLLAALTALAALPGAGIAAQAAPQVGPDAPRLELSARGEVRRTPDMGQFTVGVEARDGSASAAMDQDRKSMLRVIAALEGVGIARSDLATIGVSLSPQYTYPPNAPPRLKGYLAADSLDVRVLDLGKLGAAADAAVGAGATNLGSVALSVADPLAARNEARAAAVRALDDKAALYAKLTGFRTARLVRLSEDTSVNPAPRPLFVSAMRSEDAPTPIEAGETTISVNLQGTFALER